MVVIALALVVAAAALSVRWLTHQRDTFGRERPFPYLSIGLLGLVAMGAAIPSYLRHQEETRLSAVASQLVGEPARVHCQTFGQTFTQLDGDLGFVRWGKDGVPEHQTFIKREQCGDLKSYLKSDKQHPNPDQVVAVHVLTHESMHMRGITSEADAECAAMQRDAQTAELLGASPSAAMDLARTYWQIDYPRMPATYRTLDCKPGGPLDEHLATAPWGTPTS
ncbi:MAG: hypothetical protein JO214_11475 [Frankiaceae bacterium]|nr:hypothetical protein [Frankiaceae bacterium]